MFESNIHVSETTDIGTAIQGLIQDNIKTINTAFLGKIKAIENNMVEITPALKHEDEEDIVISDVPIGCLYSGAFHIQFKLEVGDIGLCIACQNDITLFKQEKDKINTYRMHDINDVIFLPLSLLKQKNNDDLGLIISNEDETLSIELKENKMTIKAEEIEIEAKNTVVSSQQLEITSEEVKISSDEVNITSQNPMQVGTNKTLLDCFNAILDNLETGIMGGVTTGSAATQTITQLPMLQAAITQMKATINEVLK